MFARLRFGRIVTVLTVLSLFVAGCGGDDPIGPDIPEPAQGSPTAPIKLTVTATEFDLELSRKSVPTGLVEIELVNKGRAPHQVQLLRSTAGLPISKLIDEVRHDRDGRKTFEIADAAGGPGGLSGVAGGASQSALVSLAAGEYLLVCFVEGHVSEGMFARLRVTTQQGASAVLEPIFGAVAMDDYSFKLPDGFRGQGLYQFQNTGKEAHEASLFRLDASLDEVKKFLKEGAGGRPPGGEPTPAGGAAAVTPGQIAYAELRLEPGVYAFLCFLPDKSGRAHFERGMVTAFEIE